MDMTKFCNHTYLRWQDKKPICAICSKEFEGQYDLRFSGTFPRKDYEYKPPRELVASTSTINVLDLVGWEL